MAGATGLGMAPSTDAITMEFSRWWGYLGQSGVMASDMIDRIEGESTKYDSLQKINQLHRIVKLVERAAEIELEENEVRCKKYNCSTEGSVVKELLVSLCIL